MAVQPAFLEELLAAQVAWVPVIELVVALLMLPLVTLHVLDRLAAEAADLQLRWVRSLHVVRQVDLQLVTAATVLANIPRSAVAVDTNVVSLQAVHTLIFHMTDIALEEIIRSVGPLVFIQCYLCVARFLTLVALVRLTMHIFHVILNIFRVVEMFVAEWTRISYPIQSFVHFGVFFMKARQV